MTRPRLTRLDAAARARRRANAAPGLAPDGAVLGSGTRCWCGQPARHDWDGKTAGTPHPR